MIPAGITNRIERCMRRFSQVLRGEQGPFSKLGSILSVQEIKGAGHSEILD